MLDTNEVTFSGHVGKEPEMRFTTTGKAMLTFSVCSTKYAKNKDTGIIHEYSTWMPVVTFGERAEEANRTLSKGSPVLVMGRLSSRSWETPDGNKHYRTEIMADRIVTIKDRDTRQAAMAGSAHREVLEPETLPF